MESEKASQPTATCDADLYSLLRATLELETLTASRDREIAAIEKKYASHMTRQQDRLRSAEARLEAYYRAHHAETKSIEYAHGTLGLRKPANPGLIPLSTKWSWETITEKVIARWRRKFILPPKPAIDKVRIKRLLTEKQLAACGMKLDTAERFFIDLKRPQSKGEAA